MSSKQSFGDAVFKRRKEISLQLSRIWSGIPSSRFYGYHRSVGQCTQDTVVSLWAPAARLWVEVGERGEHVGVVVELDAAWITR